MKRILSQIIAILMVNLIVFSISSPTISYAVNELLTEHQLENQGIETDNNSVEFDVCAIDDKHTLTSGLVDDEGKIKITVNVKDAGYLDDATVDFSDTNFIITAIDKPELVGENSGKKLKLNKINGGDKVVIEATIKADIKEEVEADFFNKDNKTIFTAKYYNEKNKEKSVKKEITIHVSWNVKEANIIAAQGIKKYILVTEGETKGVLIQENISAAIKDNILPIKNSHIEIEVPKIEDELPTKVSVISTNLNGTNGKTERFNEENWKYEENGKLTIDVSNEIDENKVSWVKNAQDDFAVIYMYSEEVLNKIIEKGTKIVSNIKIEDTLYNSTDLSVSTELNAETELKEQIGSIVDFSAEIIQDEINKGFLYNNLKAADEDKKETEYSEKYLLVISDAELSGKITISPKNAKLISSEELVSEANSVNKTLKVNGEEVKKVLGENGEIILTSNGENVAVINKNTKVDNNGDYVVTFSNIGNIEIITSKPEKNGSIEFILEKAIDSNFTTTEAIIKSIDQINTNTEISIENALPVNKVEGIAKLVEPTSKASIEVNKDSFSTISQNNKIEIRAILESDSIDDKLHNNTILEISLPTYIKQTNITNCNVLYSEEIIKTSEQVLDTANGKVIQVLLSGNQTKYNSSVEKGINVVINADIEIDRLTPSRTEKINLSYKEDNDETIYKVSKDINFVAPTGLVTVSELENYEEDSEKVSLVNNEGANIAYIDAHSNSAVAIYKGQIINNYKNDISETKILGSIPNTEREGNTFNIVLKNQIKVSGENVDVYYSENANADNNLEKSANGWSKEVSDFSKVKAYLIIKTDNIEKGSSINFEMPVEIPENISFKNTDEINYTISYKNNTNVGTISENIEASKIIITTGDGPVFETEILIDENSKNVLKQSQHVNFTVKVKNAGSDATDVNLVVDETNGTVQRADYTEFEYVHTDNEFVIGNINAGETKEIQFVYTIKSNAEIGEKEFKISLNSKEITNSVEFKKNIKIEKGYVNIINLSEQNQIDKLKGGQTTSFMTILTNTSGEELSNFTINYKVSEGSTIKSAGTKTGYFDTKLSNENVTIKNGIATYKVEKLSPGSRIIFAVNVSTGYNVEKVSTISYTEGKVIGNNYSNLEEKLVSKYDISLITNANNEKDEVYEGQEIEYNYVVENIGEIDSTFNTMKASIPDGAKIKYAIVEYSENGENKTRKVTPTSKKEISMFQDKIGVGEKISIKIILKTEVFSDHEIKKGIEEKELSMSLTFSSELIQNKTSDPISYYVIYNEKIHNKLVGKEEEPENPEKPEDPKEEEKYKISGKVWLDYNKNDKQDESEKGISGISVKLIDLSTMDFIKNSNNKDIEIKTSDDGTYVFSDLEKGKYIVVFDYENTEYNISQYKKEGVSTTVNSDVIEKIISIDGKEKTVGLSDTLEINDSNIRNIDLGLSKASKFSIELTKRVSKITINNDSGITDYDYSKNPKLLGKIEIKDKYLNSSNVIVEYTITVKNTGDVSGYVTSIVDYIPEELKFSSELNKDWYLGTDGNAYNMTLAKDEIKPTESREVTIILSKKMTEENTGLVNNDAEIFDAYNKEGITNIDAEPGNKNKSENDMSSASLVVSVKTGETVTKYTILIIAIIAILTFGIYMIKIKILDKRI